jgi:hypothetical protein
MASKLFATLRTWRIGLMGPMLMMAALLAASGARAQALPGSTAPQPYTAAELQTLVGPIALYVDDLIGIVLPASAYPLQVVQAARFLDARAQNPSLAPDPAWDDSVVALLNYPEVLRMMDQNLDWTSRLGEAFVYQQMDLLNAIQQFRVLAQSAGNLRSNDYQTVSQDNGAITVVPANPQVIYVPYYEPARVVTYYSSPVVRYYPYGYPVYDYPYPAGYSFNAGFFWGVTTAFVLNWHTHYVNVYPWHYARHPYYGYRYYDRYYVRRDPPRHYDYHYQDDHDNVWRPNERWGRQPYRHDVRQDHYTQPNRQAFGADHHGSSPTGVASQAWTNATRTQQGAGPDDRQAPPATGSGDRRTAYGSNPRTPVATTAPPSSAAYARSIQRTPLKPPRSDGSGTAARATPSPSRSMVTPPPPRVASTPNRPPSPAIRMPPARTQDTPRVAPPANRATVTAPPRASLPHATPPPAASSSRPPKASSSPAPARQPKQQQAARQDSGKNSDGRGKDRP